MIKRLISVLLVFVILGSLFCTVTNAAVFKDTSKITPMFKNANYEVYLSLQVSKPYNVNYAYVAVYNRYGRMIDIQPPQEAGTRIKFYIKPTEYPVTVKAFVWSSSKTAIPFCESYTFPQIKSADDIISEQLAGFVALLKQKFTMPGSFMYDLTQILDSIDEDIIDDASNDELIIDRELFEKKYPDAYSEVKTIAKELKESGGIDKAITDLSNVINNNKEYEQLALTLFTLLGVYDYF